MRPARPGIEETGMKMQTSFNFRLAGRVATAIVVVLIAAPARAVTCDVTSTADSGSGTLREKIGDTTCGAITFAPAIVPGTINLTSGQLTINRSTIITGPGADRMTVQRSQSAFAFRIFQIASGQVVAISGVTIANGISNGRPAAGGGISNFGNLTLDGTTITGNSAQSGGGVENFQDLIVRNSTFSGNSGTYGGGIDAIGASTTITNSTFVGNSANTNVFGGGISVSSPATIINSTFVGNT